MWHSVELEEGSGGIWKVTRYEPPRKDVTNVYIFFMLVTLCLCNFDGNDLVDLENKFKETLVKD